MKKFWKIYSWIYLIVILYGIFSYALTPITMKTELTKIQFVIAYSIASLFWLIPVVGIFLYSFDKQKFMLFWKIYFIFFGYNIVLMFVDFFKAGKLQFLLPFHVIALVGLFLYSFTKK